MKTNRWLQMCLAVVFSLSLYTSRAVTAQDEAESGFLKAFDANGDGKLVPDEIPQRIRRPLMNHADLNFDDILTPDELTNELWKKVLQYDTNKNGKLDAEELKPRDWSGQLAAAQAKFVDKVTLVEDIEYATGPDYANDRGKLDVCMPKGRENVPVIFFIHGGGLSKGDKTSVRAVGMRFATEGFGIVAMNYRLSSYDPRTPGAMYPDHIEDIAKAFRWTYDNMGQHGGDRDRIFVLGHSAGGGLSAALTLDERYLKAQGLSSKNIKGCVNISGLADVNTLGEMRKKVQFHGDPEIYKKASPITYVRKDAPPMIILVAENEDPDRIDENRRLYEALKKVGHPDVAFTELEDRTHPSVLPNMVKEGDQAYGLMLSFMENHGAGNIPVSQGPSSNDGG